MSPDCHQNDTVRQPIRITRAGILVAKPNDDRGGRLTRKLTIVLALLGVAALAAVSVAGASSSKRTDSNLTGAGSSFVAPLVAVWTQKVDSALGIKITYGPIGSGGGINAIINRTVDFGASDAPLTPDQFAACHGCVQIPWALSATSIPYHLDGAPNRLKLTASVLSQIFLGQITRWSDPRIKKINKGANLPDTPITLVHRSDGSGTTFNVTDYLSHVSSAWKTRVGKGTAVDWPTGVGAKGSSGVAAAVSSTNGAIGYVDVAYALKNHLKFAAVQNKAGKFVLPGLAQIAAAASTINRVAPDNGGISIVNPAKTKKDAYPICTFTYVIVPKNSPKAADLKKFVKWALTTGQGDGKKLLFQPIPKVVLKASLKTIALVHS
jgi:phosphate transport system substrate-binding protein